MKKFIYLLFAAGMLLNACQLDEKPVTSVDKDAIFGSQDGLQTYSYSFYNMFFGYRCALSGRLYGGLRCVECYR